MPYLFIDDLLQLLLRGVVVFRGRSVGHSKGVVYNHQSTLYSCKVENKRLVWTPMCIYREVIVEMISGLIILSEICIVIFLMSLISVIFKFFFVLPSNNHIKFWFCTICIVITWLRLATGELDAVNRVRFLYICRALGHLS